MSRPQINRQSKPASAFQQPGAGGAPRPSINRNSKPMPDGPSSRPVPPSKPTADDPIKLLQICQMEGIEQAMCFLNVYWDELNPQRDPPAVRQISTLFDQIARGAHPQQARGNELMGPPIAHFLQAVSAQFGGTPASLANVKDYLVGVGLEKGSPALYPNSLPLMHFLLFRYRLDWHRVGSVSVAPFQEEMGRAKEKVSAAHQFASRALFTFQEANRLKEESEQALAANQSKVDLEVGFQRADSATQAAEAACNDARAALAAADAYLKDLSVRGVAGGQVPGTLWWLGEEMHMAQSTVSNVTSGNARNSAAIRKSMLSLGASNRVPSYPGPAPDPKPQPPTQKPQPPSQKPQPPSQKPPTPQGGGAPAPGGAAAPGGGDFNSFMMSKLTLDDLEDEPPKRRQAEPRPDSLFDGGRQQGGAGSSTAALRRLKEAEEMNQQSLESLQRQQAYLSNVGYKLEDMDRTLEAGDHYLKACDGYLGAFQTTVSGPNLRGKDMGRGEGGEPMLDEEGNLIRFGYSNTGEPTLFTPPPQIRVPQAATGEQYANMGTTSVSSRANSAQRAKFEQQERELDEMNALLANVTAMNRAVGTEVASQDVQIRAVTSKQTDTQYNVERSTHKLNKLL